MTNEEIQELTKKQRERSDFLEEKHFEWEKRNKVWSTAFIIVCSVTTVLTLMLCGGSDWADENIEYTFGSYAAIFVLFIVRKLTK